MHKLQIAALSGALALLASSALAAEDLRIDFRHDAAPPIPAFARMYNTACSTCHVAAPKLNVLGEAFRANGYQMPESELLIRSDDPISLGAEPWRQLWPRAIWPSDLPGQFPLSLRIQSDIIATRDPGATSSLNYHFPHEIYLLAGTPLGRNMGVFFESEWAPGHEFEVIQAKLAIQNVLPGVEDGRLNLWLGLLNPQLLSFTDRQTDRSGRQKFSWQEFKLSSLALEDGAGTSLRSTNDLVLGTGIPAVEFNGRLGGRFRYGIGVSQGVSTPRDDANSSKDLYYRVAYKFGGLDFAGQYDEGGGPTPGAGGQLLDHSVTVEHFAYFGSEDRTDAPAGAHRAVGAAIRLLRGPLDLGVGVVERRFEDPYGLDVGEAVTARSWFGKAEYLAYPWLILSGKVDRLDVSVPDGTVPPGFAAPGADVTRVIPGIVALVRQNVRAVIEGEIFTDRDASDRTGQRRPHTLWIRLDLAF